VAPIKFIIATVNDDSLLPCLSITKSLQKLKIHFFAGKVKENFTHLEMNYLGQKWQMLQRRGEEWVSRGVG
jgi:hypothetical protein